MSQQQSFIAAGSAGVVNQVTGNNGVTASPTTGNVVVSGIQSTTTQIGVVTLATNAETLAGTDTSKVTTPDDIKAKLGAQTLHGLAYGNSNTAAVQWLAEATDGQIPIGQTGGAPVLANITSNNGSVTVTNAAGSIDLSVTNGVVNEVTGTNGVTAAPTSGNVVVSGIQSTTTQIGVVTLATNAETLAGTDTSKVTTPDDIKAKLGAQTLHGLAYGNSNTAAVQWLAEATDGQIPIGQTGGAPVLANITSNNGTLTITNGPGSIDLSVTNENVGTATTNGAVTSNIITVPLVGGAGTYQFEARVKAFNPSTPSSAGYNVYATLRTDGSTATLVGNQSVFNEDATLAAADAYFIASGNNAVLQVLGVVGLTINWSAETELT